MGRVIDFIRRERLYVLLLIFIILINVLMALPEDVKVKGKEIKEVAATKEVYEDMVMKRQEMEKVLSQNKYLALLLSLTTLLILAVILLGIMIDAILLSYKFGRNKLDIATHRLGVVQWGITDVAKVVILFLFFGYMIVIIESALMRVFPIVKNDNFRMILNSSILDILSVIFILYFTVNQYKEKFLSLGITLKNFARNVYYGIAGYIAVVPLLIGTLIIISIIINITKYVPEKQPVVELFLKEKNVTFLLYTSIFASVVGPFIEELFFRGFMYNAFKKRIGIFWAMLFTSAVFATLHSNLAGFVPILILGITLTYLYEKTGSLVSSITVHVIHNLSMVFLVFLMKQVRV